MFLIKLLLFVLAKPSAFIILVGLTCSSGFSTEVEKKNKRGLFSFDKFQKENL